MTEPDVIHCMQCKQTFNRSSKGAQQYLDHRQTCPNSHNGYASNHPTDHSPKGAA